MLVIKITRNRVTKRALAEARAVLRAGGVVAFPTETAYGLAADPTNPDAVARVFAIKGRPERKPLPLVAATVAAVRARFLLTGLAAKLAARWPGPLTILLPIRSAAKRAVVSTGDDGTAAVRVPASTWARAIAEAAGGVATSTSANRSGGQNLYSGAAVVAEFGARRIRPDLLLDAGPLPPRMPSTIVAVRGTGRNARIEVLRQGSVRVPGAEVRYHTQ